MPARLRQAKSDTYVPEPVGFAIPEAKMRVLRTVILAVRFVVCRRMAGRGRVSFFVSRTTYVVVFSIGRGKDLPILPRHTSKIQAVRPF